MTDAATHEFAYQDLSYEDRYVAFVDVMGWRDAVMATGPRARDPRDLGWLIKVLGHTKSGIDATERFAKQMPVPVGALGSVRASQFSDSIIISAPATASHDVQRLLVSHLGELCAVACQSGFLVRGAVVRGELFHRDNIAFGPSLIRAVELEEREAYYPRIILDEDLREDFLPGVPIKEDAVVVGHTKSWRADSDGRVFFDFMQPFNAVRRTPENGGDDIRIEIHQFGQYKHLICKGLIDQVGNPRVYEKYLWCRDYFIAMMAEYPDINVPVVAIDVGDQLVGFEKNIWPGSRPHATLSTARQ